MLTTVLALAALAFAPLPAPLPTPAPPEFQRGTDGAATDGQLVRQPAAKRRQLVAILPDRTTGRDWGLRYLAEAVDDFNRIKPDAVFCVGDLVQGYSRDHAVVAAEQDDFLTIVKRLSMPFYPTAGNHDLVSGLRTSKDRSFADEYRARFGPLYYAVELDLASFVVLNSEDGDGEISPGFSDAQLAWLDRSLQRLAMRGKPIVLLFHRPLWDHKPTKWDERVQPILVRHGVKYVIAGHYHALQSLPPRDGIPFIVLGTCGGMIDQHPLAGQLQHTTYLSIDEDGAIDLYHQIAGTTLPPDWITKADQDLAYSLKSAADAVSIRGAVADPLGVAVDGSVEVILKNPLDRAVRWSFAQAAQPKPWFVDDKDPRGGQITRVWTSRTEIDAFNRPTTDLGTPFRLALPNEPIVLAPGASTTVRIGASADAQAAPPEPPPFDITASFDDSRGRTVPIVLRQRLPIARTITLGKSLAAAIAYPIAVWQWSPYDTPDQNPTARLAQGSANAVLDIELTVPDTRLSPDAKPTEARAALDDPLGDGVRLVLGEGPETREYLVSFASPGDSPKVRTLNRDGRTLGPTEAVWAVFSKSGTAWALKLSVGKDALPDGARLAGLRLNIGVADNDETYHTQWRWLAPRSIPAKLEIGAP